MNERIIQVLLIGILVCLIVIITKPNNSNNSNINPPLQASNINIESGDKIIKLEGDKIVVIDTDQKSGLRGTMLVFQLNKKNNSFNLIGKSSYGDILENPNLYGLPIK